MSQDAPRIFTDSDQSTRVVYYRDHTPADKGWSSSIGSKSFDVAESDVGGYSVVHLFTL